MPTIQEYYDLTLHVDSTEIEDSAASYSFTMQDSIFDIYNTANLILPDDSGLYQEYLGTMPGMPIDIEFGLNGKKSIKSPYVALKYENQEIQNIGTLGGPIKIDLINKWYNDQSRLSEGFKNRISEIVRSKVANVGFSSIDINDTGNLDSWYQGLQFDAQFIKNMAYYAFSTNSENSPYYVFVNNNNEFNFRNYYSLIASNEVANLRYVPDEEHNTDINVVRDIKPYTNGYADIRDGLRRTLFSYDDNGELEVSEDKLTEYYAVHNQTYPVYRNENITGYFSTEEKKLSKGATQSDIASTINSNSKRMNIDKMIVILAFNPNLLSGKTIKLDIHTYGSNDASASTLSQLSSTKWLIERSYHMWDGENQTGLTKLVIGRKYTLLNNQYLKKDKTFK